MNGAGPSRGKTLTTDHLVKVYRGASRPALNNLTLSIDEGQVFGLLGPNGAGKTTAISVMNSLLKPTSGGVTVCGIDVVQHPRQAKKLIGYVPQDIALFPDLTVRENLRFFGRIYGLTGKELEGRINECAEFVGLEGNLAQRIYTFSGGMKRRANLAAGLLHEPKILFLDEPTVGIDPQSRKLILERLATLKNKTTMVYTTHYMREAELLCSYIAIMDAGEIIAEGTPQDLLRRDPSCTNLEELFIVLTGKQLRD
jgi:ABC-2 type transport system ATP-binding protein